PRRSAARVVANGGAGRQNQPIRDPGYNPRRDQVERLDKRFPAAQRRDGDTLRRLGPARTLLVLMKWYPGYMSAPHTYATDRLSLVLSGTGWGNSGPDFDPKQTVPAPAGGSPR